MRVSSVTTFAFEILIPGSKWGQKTANRSFISRTVDPNTTISMNFETSGFQDEDDLEEDEEEEQRFIRGSKHRSPEYGVDLLFLDRWSPRAMSGEPLSEFEFMSLIEAARWAPSSYNNQPWRFLYAFRDSEHWETFKDLLVDFNRNWAKDASVLMVVISKTHFEHNDTESRTHSFDAGAAWENLALQGARNGLVVHAMEGFDLDAARDELDIPDEFDIEAMVAIGKPGDPENLPEDLQERESPSGRKPISEIVIEGPYQD